jgi:hypothetical protein
MLFFFRAQRFHFFALFFLRAFGLFFGLVLASAKPQKSTGAHLCLPKDAS